MQNLSIDVKNKHYLMLCELHYPELHGKNEYSDPNIETHYLVCDRFEPYTGISMTDIESGIDYETDREYGSDSDDDYEDNRLHRINDSIKFLKSIYSNNNLYSNRYYGVHPTIRNYKNIIRNPNYIKPEIGEYIILPTQESIAILKTFWLRIIQKKWKKVFKERKNVIKQRCHISNLSIREIRGRWNNSCVNLPGLRGMLSDLK